MDDTQLTTLFATDALPATDRRFVVAVMARIEQRRFRRELAMTAGLAACAIGLLALLAPTLETAWQGSFAAANNVVIALMLASVTLAVPYFFPARID